MIGRVIAPDSLQRSLAEILGQEKGSKLSELQDKLRRRGIEFGANARIRGVFSVEPPANIWHGTDILSSRVGAYSYVAPFTTIIATNIGRYCSIGDHVQIGASDHETSSWSTSPAFSAKVFIDQVWPDTPPKHMLRTVTIGHDVWIGSHSRILPGVTIGHGAIIGMGAVVAKDVPPCAVVVGNPAQVKKTRIPEKLIESWLNTQWWDYDWPRYEGSQRIDWSNPEHALARVDEAIQTGQVRRINVAWVDIKGA